MTQALAWARGNAEDDGRFGDGVSSGQAVWRMWRARQTGMSEGQFGNPSADS